MKAFEALALVAQCEFNFLSEADRDCYAGVENEDARIGYYGDMVIIIDGPMVQFMYDDGEFETFFLKA